MKKRGRILKDASTGAGLISIEGKQYTFQIEGIWKSDLAPKVDMMVEVMLSDDDQPVEIRAISESQLVREHAHLAATAAKEKGTRLATDVISRFGTAPLVGMAVLIVGWFFLSTITVRMSSEYQSGLTLWQVLSLLNSPSGIMQALTSRQGSTGLYGVFAVLALLGPILPYLWKDRRAVWGNALPLVFMVAICIASYFAIQSSMREVHDIAGMFGDQRSAAMAAEMSSRMVREAMKAISFGIGGYLSLLAGIYFALKAIKPARVKHHQ